MESTRNKLKKYLQKFEGVSFHKESESGSVYYKIGSSKIRIADHQSPVNDPEVLNILFPQNSGSIILTIGGRFVIIQNYNKLKEYIRSFMLTAVCTKPIRVTKVETKIVREVTEPNEILDIHGLTMKQITGLQKLINSYRKQAKK